MPTGTKWKLYKKKQKRNNNNNKLNRQPQTQPKQPTQNFKYGTITAIKQNIQVWCTSMLCALTNVFQRLCIRFALYEKFYWPWQILKHSFNVFHTSQNTIASHLSSDFELNSKNSHEWGKRGVWVYCISPLNTVVLFSQGIFLCVWLSLLWTSEMNFNEGKSRKMC